MAKIKSVKTKSGKRVQVDSKAYNRALSAGDSAVSGTGKNLRKSDIGRVSSDFGGYEDQVSTTEAKREANAAGELLPFQQNNALAPIEDGQVEQALTPIEEPGVTPIVDAQTSAKANLSKLGYTNPDAGEIAGMMEEMGGAPSAPSPYQAGLSAWQNAGGVAPQNAGMGRAGAAQYTPQPPASSAVDTAFAEDPFYQEMQALYEDYANPKNQRDSLTQEYSKLVKKSGIDELDTELMDMKNVIDGTEDDIRLEVTKAGGFATDSQVMAMTNSRNKVLIKNYNNILQLREQKEAHIDRMIGLSAQDRQLADQRFDRMFNITGQIAQYQQQMKTNAQNQYYKLADAMGYDGLLNSAQGNPFTISLIEKTLGMPSGGLQQAASRSAQDRALQIEGQQLQNEAARASIRNTNSQISQRENDIANGVLTDAQIKAIDTSPQGKKVTTLGDLKQKLSAYQQLVDQYGTSSFGTQKSILENAYNELKIAYKTAADLGAIQAPDVPVIEGALKNATFANPLTQGWAKLTGGGVGSIKAGLNQAMTTLDNSAASNISQLYARNPEYRNSEYVASLVDPLATTVTTETLYDTAVVGQILKNPDGTFVQKQPDGTFKSL